MTRLRVGLLGVGSIAARHAGAVKALSDTLELVACCGRDAERTATFADAHGLKPFTDHERMLDDARLDLLIDAAPPYARRGESLRAAAAGVHLLVEKPVALDLTTAYGLADAAERAGVVAAAGYMYRQGEAVRRWRALSAAGETGAVGLMIGFYACNALHAPWWRNKAKSGGQIAEQLIHILDLVQLFMGPPATVFARTANLHHRATPGYDVEDVSALVFGWEDGRLASLTANNIAVPGRWNKCWTVHAERMTARFADWNRAVLTATAGEVRDEEVAGAIDPFAAQLADLTEAIRMRRPPLAPLREGPVSLAMALSAHESAAARAEIPIRYAL